MKEHELKIEDESKAKVHPASILVVFSVLLAAVEMKASYEHSAYFDELHRYMMFGVGGLCFLTAIGFAWIIRSKNSGVFPYALVVVAPFLAAGLHAFAAWSPGGNGTPWQVVATAQFMSAGLMLQIFCGVFVAAILRIARDD